MDQIIVSNEKLSQIEVREVSRGSYITVQDIFDPSILNEINSAIKALHPFKKRLLHMGVGKWFIGHFKKKIWKSPLSFYAWKCPDCGKVAFGYPHGYSNDLYCLNCFKPD